VNFHSYGKLPEDSIFRSGFEDHVFCADGHPKWEAFHIRRYLYWRYAVYIYIIIYIYTILYICIIIWVFISGGTLPFDGLEWNIRSRQVWFRGTSISAFPQAQQQADAFHWPEGAERLSRLPGAVASPPMGLVQMYSLFFCHQWVCMLVILKDLW
jgi:hypothetical protein